MKAAIVKAEFPTRKWTTFGSRYLKTRRWDDWMEAVSTQKWHAMSYTHSTGQRSKRERWQTLEQWGRHDNLKRGWSWTCARAGAWLAIKYDLITSFCVLEQHFHQARSRRPLKRCRRRLTFQARPFDRSKPEGIPCFHMGTILLFLNYYYSALHNLPPLDKYNKSA